MEACILGNGSICHLLQHSKDFQTRFNKHVQELDGHPVHGPVAGAVKLWESFYGFVRSSGSARTRRIDNGKPGNRSMPS